MGFLTWVVTGAVVGLLWRSSGRGVRLGDVVTGITGAVLLGAGLRGLAEFDVQAFRPVGVRIFTWPNLIQAAIGSAVLMLLFRGEKAEESD